LLPPGPEQSWLMMTLRRCWAETKELARSKQMTSDRNQEYFMIDLGGDTETAVFL
jgi:hypothetical protein